MGIDDPHKLMAQAFALVKQGKLTDADKLYAQICVHNETNGKAWFMRGAIQYEFGEMNRALEYMCKVIRIDPANTDAHFTLCKISVSLGNLTEAMVHVKRVLELAPERGEAWLALGSFYADTGSFQHADDPKADAPRSP